MVGGATSGYWAIGNFRRATEPTMTMTIDSTVAKIGRSMKTCENMRPPSLVLGCLVGWFGRRAGHGALVGIDLGLVTDPLNAVDNDPVVGLDALQNDLQAATHPPELDFLAFGDVLAIDDVD